MNSKNVIELNGKRYDAVTGAIVAAPAIQTPSVAAKTPAPKVMISDVMPSQRASKIAAAPHAASIHAHVRPNTIPRTPKPVVTMASTPKSAPARSIAITQNHTIAHKPQVAKTLMRTAVTRPAPGFKKQINVQTSLTHDSSSLVVKKTAISTITPERLARASTINRSQHIAKFDASKHHAPHATIAHIPVQTPPKKPVTEPGTAPSPQPTNKPLDMFEQALANATNFVDTKAHRASFNKKARRHVASMAAGTLALFIIGAFAVYQNTPGLQLKFAGLQAGFSTTMPNLKAAGFAYTGVKAQSGKLTLGLRSQDGTAYQLSQTTTNWSGKDMIQNISSVNASGYPNFQTIQAGNTAIYRFDNTSATWVKNGKWYQVTGTGALTDTQVKALAINS